MHNSEATSGANARSIDWGIFASGRGLTALFILFSVVAVVPIWMVKYPPMVDYPNHLARAFVLHHLHDPNYNFGNWFAPDWGPNPYFLADFLLQLFQYALGIYAAGKLMLTLCVLGLPWATLFFLRRANPGNDYLALWAFVVAYNPNMLMGFMSFELSIALCFVVVGVWLDFVRTGKTSTWLLTLVLTTLLFLTHLGGFAIAGVALTIYTLTTSGISRQLLWAELLFVPGGAFFLYGKLHGWAGRGLDYQAWVFNQKFRTMLTPFQGYSRAVEAVILLGLAVTAVYFFARREKLKIHAPWIAVCLVILAVHWIVPDRYGDLGFVNTRFCIFAFLFALAIPSFNGPRNWLVAMASLIFLLHTAQVGQHFLSVQTRLAKIANTFQTIPDRSLVLAYTAKGDGAWVDSTDLHFWAYGVIDRGWISPSLFHQNGVQPLGLRVPMYADDDQYGDKLIDGKYNIQSIGKSYDYVWACNVPYMDAWLDEIAEPVMEQGTLEIYRSKRLSGWNTTSQLNETWPQRLKATQ
jgi:hypothetical protein